MLSSPLVFISSKIDVFLFKKLDLLLIFSASLRLSTESIVSKRSKHLLTLFVWRCPMNRRVMLGIKSKDSNFLSASWILFSPIWFIPALYTSTISWNDLVFEAAIILTRLLRLTFVDISSSCLFRLSIFSCIAEIF